MSLSADKRRELLAASLPKSAAVANELRDYLARTGLLPPDFARRINYSNPAINAFLRGDYAAIAANDAPIRQAILDFIRAHPIEPLTQMPGVLYETENVRLLRHYFNDALNRGRAYYVEGNPGTQKSFVLQYLVAELNRTELAKNGEGRRAYYIYCEGYAGADGRSRYTPARVMKLVAEACGCASSGDAHRIARNLRFDLAHRRALLVFDEAQHLNVAAIEFLRGLLDLPPRMGLLFAGSHQLRRMFVRNALDLEQWNSRFHGGKTLPGLSEAEAFSIASAELPRDLWGSEKRKKKIEQLIKGAHVSATGSDGQMEYISARRLFEALQDLKLAVTAKENRGADATAKAKERTAVGLGSD